MEVSWYYCSLVAVFLSFRRISTCLGTIALWWQFFEVVGELQRVLVLLLSGGSFLKL
jgi:hypothetical protein